MMPASNGASAHGGRVYVQCLFAQRLDVCGYGFARSMPPPPLTSLLCSYDLSRRQDLDPYQFSQTSYQSMAVNECGVRADRGPPPSNSGGGATKAVLACGTPQATLHADYHGFGDQTLGTVMVESSVYGIVRECECWIIGVQSLTKRFVRTLRATKRGASQECKGLCLGTDALLANLGLLRVTSPLSRHSI